jgi:ABC-2 type transport system permease protein
MKKILFLLKKEFLQIARNKELLRVIVMLPIIQLSILPWAATYEIKHINLCIIDNDISSSSKKLIEKFCSSQYFDVVRCTNSYENALNEMEKGSISLILEIPKYFEKLIIQGNLSKLNLSADALNAQNASIAISYITQIISQYEQQYFPKIQISEIRIEPQYRYNSKMNYIGFMVPGFLIILVTMMGIMQSSQNIVREKEMGTIEQINVSPIHRITFMLGKIVPFWIIGLVNLSFGMFLSWIIYGLFPNGNILNIYLFAFFYLLAFTGFGLTISNFAQNQQQAMFVVVFFVIILVLTSGLFTPINSMPDWTQVISSLNPLRYFAEVIRLVYIRKGSLLELRPYLYKIFAFVIFFNVTAILSYRKNS